MEDYLKDFLLTNDLDGAEQFCLQNGCTAQHQFVSMLVQRSDRSNVVRRFVRRFCQPDAGGFEALLNLAFHKAVIGDFNGAVLIARHLPSRSECSLSWEEYICQIAVICAGFKTLPESVHQKTLSFYLQTGNVKGIDRLSRHFNLNTSLAEPLRSALDCEFQRIDEASLAEQLSESALKSSVLGRLETYLRSREGLGRFALFEYGSSSTGLASSHSDIDVCIAFPDTPTQQKKAVIAMIESLGAVLGGFPTRNGNIRIITQARVPIVRVTDSVTRKQVDLSVQNFSSVANSGLQRAMINSTPSVRMFCRAVVQWAKRRVVKKHGLSVYGWTVLALAFLQKESVLPLVDVLGRLESSGRSAMLESLKVNISDSPADSASTLAVAAGLLEDPQLFYKLCQCSTSAAFGVSGMLMKFWGWAASRLLCKHDQVVSLRSLFLTKESKGWTEHGCPIEDPVELEHNLATSTTHRMAKVYAGEALRAMEMMNGNLIGGRCGCVNPILPQIGTIDVLDFPTICNLLWISWGPLLREDGNHSLMCRCTRELASFFESRASPSPMEETPPEWGRWDVPLFWSEAVCAAKSWRQAYGASFLEGMRKQPWSEDMAAKFGVTSPAGGGEATSDMDVATAGRSLPIELVDSIEAAAACVERIKQCSVLAVDLEGLAEDSVALVQIAGDEKVWLFDVAGSGGKSILELLKPVLEGPSIKIFHDCRTDTQALWNVARIQLHNVIDTQAMYCALRSDRGAQLLTPSLSMLLEEYFGIPPSLLKSEMKMAMEGGDIWTARPLPERQLEYAAMDVVALHHLAAIISCEMSVSARALAGKWSFEYANAWRAGLTVRGLHDPRLASHEWIPGVVQNIQQYGVFVSLTSGLLHNSKMPEERGKRPSFHPGEVIRVRAEQVDRKRGRLALTMLARAGAALKPDTAAPVRAKRKRSAMEGGEDLGMPL